MRPSAKTEKERLRDRIAAQINEYLERGGQISLATSEDNAGTEAHKTLNRRARIARDKARGLVRKPEWDK